MKLKTVHDCFGRKILIEDKPIIPNHYIRTYKRDEKPALIWGVDSQGNRIRISDLLDPENICSHDPKKDYKVWYDPIEGRNVKYCPICHPSYGKE